VVVKNTNPTAKVLIARMLSQNSFQEVNQACA